MSTRRALPLALVVVLVSAALAGCAGRDKGDAPLVTTPTDPAPTEATPTPTPSPTATPPPSPTPTPPTPPLAIDSSTFALAATGYPGQVRTGDSFTFTLFVNGSVTRSSDHIGAHFADNESTSPPVVPGRVDCVHVGGTMPGVFNVTCEMSGAGTWYVFPHAQVNESGTLINWWGEPPFVVRARNYEPALNDLPTTPVASGAAFSFSLNITGSENVSSDFVAVEYWTSSQSDDSLGEPAGACWKQEGLGAVGNYPVECEITQAALGTQEFFLRGHVRITAGGTTLDWHSAEARVEIIGNPLS